MNVKSVIVLHLDAIFYKYVSWAAGRCGAWAKDDNNCILEVCECAMNKKNMVGVRVQGMF